MSSIEIKKTLKLVHVTDEPECHVSFTSSTTHPFTHQLAIAFQFNTHTLPTHAHTHTHMHTRTRTHGGVLSIILLLLCMRTKKGKAKIVNMPTLGSENPFIELMMIFIVNESVLVVVGLDINKSKGM